MGDGALNGSPVVRGAIHIDATEDVAVTRVRKLGCRVLAVSRRGTTAVVLVELPGWSAIHAVTRAAIYDGLHFENDGMVSDIRRPGKYS